ncbi:MAG: DUF3015 domain-containing protein [Gammaproteobacteria bacterium]|nr:DUF3015 domain-containing protein [Gammaproteobacteria bacterium]MCF6230373.1 DUF3015 domain-containing protein [Gammaproteobacteria bacterium]
MKKTILAGVMALAMAPMASQAETGAGCGLGSMLLEGQQGLVFNVLAATVNGTSGNQTFGMTSGTLGCDGEGTVTFAAAGEYLDANMEQVARGMATGEGEAMDTLASLMGVSAADKAAFVQVSKANFSVIFSKENVTSADVMSSLTQAMAADQSLSKYIS